MSLRYRVVLTGEVLAGFDRNEVRDAFAQAFRLGAEQLDKVFSGRRVLIKRDLSAEEAARLAVRIRQMGLAVDCEPVMPAPPVQKPEPAPAQKPEPLPVLAAARAASAAAASEELFSLAAPAPAAPLAAAPEAASPPVPPGVESVTCPQCGEIQPKRTLCRKCGLDMPRYHAARAAAEQEAREARVAEREAAREPARGLRGARASEPVESPDVGARLFAFGFSGRLGRLGYLAGSLLSTVLLILAMSLAMVTGAKTFAGIGFLISLVYGFRVVALRLHDTGRTGWLSLVLLVPLIGTLLALALLFIGGDEGENDYGMQPTVARGGAALLSFVACVLSSALLGSQIEANPAQFARIAGAVGWNGGGSSVGKDMERDERPPPSTRYSGGNLVVLYSTDNCPECDSMRRWLGLQDFRFVERHVDADQRAAEQLVEKLHAAGYDGRVQLPVVEVNGVLLPDRPSPQEVHRHLKPAEQM